MKHLFSLILFSLIFFSCSNLFAQEPILTILTSDNISQAQEIDRLGHGTLYATALHPTQNWVAVGSSSGWEILSLPELTRVSFSQGYAGEVHALVWSPDGTLLLTGSHDGILRLWEPVTGQLLEKFPAHDEAILALDWSNNAQFWATGSADNTVKILFAESAELHVQFQGHQNDVRTVAFSPDGQYLATGSGGENASSDATVRLWEPETKRYLSALRGHQYAVNALAWSSDGQTLYSGGYAGNLIAWNITNYATHNQWKFPAIKDLIWSPDHTQLAVITGRGVDVWDGSTILWNPVDATHSTLTYTKQNNIPLLAGVWYEDYLLAISEDYRQVIGLWDTEQLEFSGEIVPVDFRAYDFDWSPNSEQIAIATHEHGLRIWDLGQNTQGTRLLGHDFERYWGVAWSPDGEYLATSLDGVRLWEMPSGAVFDDIKIHNSSEFAYQPVWIDNNILTYYLDDGTIYGISLQGENFNIDTNMAPLAKSQHVSPDGAMLAIGQDDGSIEIWTWDASTLLTTLWGHSSTVQKVRWAPNGQYLASSGIDGSLRVWGLVE